MESYPDPHKDSRPPSLITQNEAGQGLAPQK